MNPRTKNPEPGTLNPEPKVSKIVGMPPTTPYSADLGNRDPLLAMRESAARYRAIAGDWSPADFERSYAPGKWTARQLLIHLAQVELALGTRARMALVTPNYVAQNFDQDAWVALERGLSGRDALDVFLALVAMNRSLFEALSPAERATPLAHPEYGALSVDWILHQLAGHEIHHVSQLEKCDGR
jgi:hypothetical protein